MIITAKAKRKRGKPKILQDKILLADYCKRKLEPTFIDKSITGYFWRGEFIDPVTGNKFGIYFQMGVRRRGVSYIKIYWVPGYKAFTVKEIKERVKLWPAVIR